MRRIAVLGCTLIVYMAASRAEEPFVTVQGDTGHIAWWVLADFHPFTTEVRGIPVNKIRKSWCKATEFRKDLFPRELMFDEDGSDAMEGLSFALEGNFDGSATKQVALVGVYEECTGQKGRFFMILDQPAGGKPKVRLLDAVQTPHQFGALSIHDDKTIIVWACMQCDNLAKLRWDRKRHRFIWLPPPAEE
jgi:hypothetical protein